MPPPIMKWVTSGVVEQQWAHLCQSRPNYLLFPPNQPGITAIISHCVFFSLLATFSVKFHFNWVLNFWSKSAKDPETYFMSEPERRCGLFACGRLHRIRISDEDSWGIGKQKSLTQTMIAISPCVHCSIHRCEDHYSPRTRSFRQCES